MSIEIKNAPADLRERIIEMCSKTYLAHRAAQPRHWPGNFFELMIKPAIEAAFKGPTGHDLSESPTLFVAMKDAEFAGYYRLSHLPTDPKKEYFNVGIDDICVLPKFRKQGIATAMIEHAKGLARTHDWDVLEATIADPHATSLHLFKSQGFDVYSRKLAFGPERQARDVPDLRKRMRFAWLWTALAIWGVGLLLAMISR